MNQLLTNREELSFLVVLAFPKALKVQWKKEEKKDMLTI